MPKGALPKPSQGVVNALLDERVVGTALGVGLEWFAEKAIYSANRKVFGFAKQDQTKPNAPIIFTDVEGKENPSIANARLMLKLGIVLGGTLLMMNAEEEGLQFFGLGVASAALTHTVQHHIMRSV